MPEEITSIQSYMGGEAHPSTSIQAFIMANVAWADFEAFMYGSAQIQNTRQAYIRGKNFSSTSAQAYINGGTPISSSQQAFMLATSATNPYVILDGRRYAVRETLYEPVREKFQQVRITVAGAHYAQSWNFTEYRWGLNLRVPYLGTPTYGGLDDLKAAYQKAYVSYTDHYRIVHDVFFEGRLQEIPDSPLLDGDAVFTVPVFLRKRQ